MTTWPKLYPGHRHHWTDDLLGSNLVRCEICGFEVPRQLADLEPNEPRPPQPEQETRT